MDNQRNTAVADQSQEARPVFSSDVPRGFQPVDLSPSDRRLLLRSTLGLFLRRLRHGIPVLKGDLLGLATYADDPRMERAA